MKKKKRENREREGDNTAHERTTDKGENREEN